MGKTSHRRAGGLGVWGKGASLSSPIFFFCGLPYIPVLLVYEKCWCCNWSLVFYLSSLYHPEENAECCQMSSIWSLTGLSALLLDSKTCVAGISTYAEGLGCLPRFSLLSHGQEHHWGWRPWDLGPRTCSAKPPWRSHLAFQALRISAVHWEAWIRVENSFSVKCLRFWGDKCSRWLKRTGGTNLSVLCDRM